MLSIFRRNEINRLLIKRAGISAYLEYWRSQKVSIGMELRELAEINERLRQLGYKEQDNG